MKKKNGFTLIELLAVIVIMGILMLVAIPAISRVIENSRKDTFVDIAKSYVNAARNLWTTDNLTCEGRISSAVDDGDYYILINTKDTAKDHLPVLLDQGGKSSWGNRNVSGYVRVNVKTTDGTVDTLDEDGDGNTTEWLVEPKRTVKFYVALTDGTHGLVDDNTKVSDNLVRGDIKMDLSESDLKKIQLTVDDGKLDCAKSAEGVYSCAEVTPIKNIAGICVDDNTSAEVTGNGGTIPAVSFADDDWNTIIASIRSGTHPYDVEDTKEVDMGSFGTHTIRIANLSTPSECSQEGFSQTACGVVLEFADIITTYKMNSTDNNVGGWPTTRVRTYVNDVIYNSLPEALKSAIIDTKVVSGHGPTVGETNFITTDKLYLLSPAEISTDFMNNYDTSTSLTRQLDYYANNDSVSIKQHDQSNQWWWLRSATSNSTTYFFAVRDGGDRRGTAANTTRGISPAFRIG